MKEIKIIGSALPTFLGKTDQKAAACRSGATAQNPIIKRNGLPDSNSIFNSAVVKFKDGFAGIFRCDDKESSYDSSCRFQQGCRATLGH